MVAPKREKMACQGSMTQKKGGNHVSKKKETGMIRERKAITSRSKPHLSIHPSIHSYTCTFWSRLHDLFLHGSSFLTLQHIEYKCARSYPTLAPQRLVVVGKIKDRYRPGKEIQVECLERVILGTLPYFQKSFKKSISRWIADLWASKYYSMHRSNSQ